MSEHVYIKLEFYSFLRFEETYYYIYFIMIEDAYENHTWEYNSITIEIQDEGEVVKATGAERHIT